MINIQITYILFLMMITIINISSIIINIHTYIYIDPVPSQQHCSVLLHLLHCGNCLWEVLMQFSSHVHLVWSIMLIIVNHHWSLHMRYICTLDLALSLSLSLSLYFFCLARLFTPLQIYSKFNSWKSTRETELHE